MTDSSDTHRQARIKASTADIRFAPGELLAGKYEVISFIGSGGMSQVFRVRQVYLNKVLALKVLDAGDTFNELQVRRFQVEGKAVFSLNHANLVRVYDFGELETSEHYLAMDFIDGPTLSDYVKSNGPLKPEVAIPLFLKICDGLAYAHQQGIVHRDLKPSNIMLVSSSRGDGQFMPQIVDFGIAKVMSADGGEIQALTKTGEIFGSPLYMSPEQCSGERVDYRSDIYSLGCTFFEVLTGTPPHVGANALRTMMLHQGTPAPLLREASLGEKFSDGLEDILHRMLEKSPKDRYQNVNEVMDDFRDLQAGRKKIPVRQNVVLNSTPSGASNTLIKVSVIAALTAVVVGSSIVATVALLRNKQASLAAAPPVVNVVSKPRERTLTEQVDGVFTIQHKEALKARDSFAKVQKIEAVDFVEHGITKRKIVFPNRSIGAIATYVSFDIFNKELLNMTFEGRGPRVVDRDAKLSLTIGGASSNAIKDPSIFKKISPTLFDELKIKGCHIDLMIDGEDVKAAQDANILQILQDCERWEKLQSISFSGILLTKNEIDSLNKYEHLKILGLDGITGDISNLSEQPFMRNITGLALTNCAASKLLEKFCGSSTITDVGLCAMPDLNESIRSVATFKKMKNIVFKGEPISEDVVKNLEKMTTLTHVQFFDVPVTLPQIRRILKLPKLHEIILAGSSRAAWVGQPNTAKVYCVQDSEIKPPPQELMSGGY